jgi:hypothetical protein
VQLLLARQLGVDHGEIKHGTYYYSDPSNPSKVKEEVRYWTRILFYEFIQTQEGLINGYSLSPLEIDYIHIVHGGYHGKNKFCFALKEILCMKNGESYSQVVGLADVACRKDHAIILDNTCMPWGSIQLKSVTYYFRMHRKMTTKIPTH